MDALGQSDRVTSHGHHGLLDHDHHGWTAVPRSLDAFLKDIDKSKVKDIPLSLIKFPTSEVTKRTKDYAQQELPEPTYNHSMRVFYWGLILLKTFPELNIKQTPGLIETFYLSCLLHDIGTVPTNIKATRLSFELWGAIKSSSLLAEYGAPSDQADLVAETINRHQDLGETGSVPAVLALIYFGTLFDNVGANGDLIHKSTIQAVCDEFPRISWSHCFSSTIAEEIHEKPWAHTTVIDDFAEKVEGNKLMQPYD